MSTAAEVQGSLESFAESCNANERLGAMIRDWNRVLHIQATDAAADLTLITESGKVTVATGAPPVAHLTIQSTAEILASVFYGELSPNEPYNEGTLRIQGPEDDIVRLDFVIAMLWE
jgi:putative sterol carrier protein